MHTLMPVIALRRGALAVACGSMGGGGQPQINAMSLMRRFGLGIKTSQHSSPRDGSSVEWAWRHTPLSLRRNLECRQRP